MNGYFNFSSPIGHSYTKDFNLIWQKSLPGKGFRQLSDSSFYTIYNNGDINYRIYNNLGNTLANFGFGGNRDEWVNVHNNSLKIDDKIYVVGSTESSNSGSVGVTNASLYNPDIWLICLNTNGQLLWQKSYGALNKPERGYSIIATKDGNFFILGSSYLNDNYNVWTLKIDKLGNVIWQKNIFGNGFDFPRYVTQDIDGGFLVLINSSSANGPFSGNLGLEDSFLVKLSSDGNLLWSMRFGGQEEDYLKKILIAKNGDYYLLGETSSIEYNASGHHGPFTLNHSEGDIWIIKLRRANCVQSNPLLLSGNYSGFSYFNTDSLIEINGKGMENSIFYISGKNAISLNPGFETKQNSTSTINIQGCEN